MGLKEKCVLITGSSRGIGKAIALTLAEYGANVAVNYVKDKEGKIDGHWEKVSKWPSFKEKFDRHNVILPDGFFNEEA